jgi:transcriptional regulator with XRE-family HTH domain
MPRSLHSERYKRLCERLFDARKKAGLTQAELSARLNRPQSYISKYESGERRLDVIELLDVAQALQISPAGLLQRL